MPITHNLEQSVPFDPGYAPHLVPFLPAISAINEELAPIKNFGQKKLRFKVLSKIGHKAFLSTLGFWVGCILWGAFIKYKFEESPKPISGNGFIGLTKEDVESFAYNEEFEAMTNYIQTYSKDQNYYLGKYLSLPKFCDKIVAEYKEFVAINDNFLNSKTTNDIQIPENFGFLAEYSDSKLDELYEQITEIIEGNDLSQFLELELLKSVKTN
jgi:hypothetical protein